MSRKKKLVGARKPDSKQPDGNKYFLQYKKKTKGRGRAKAAGWVDMDLPPIVLSVVGGDWMATAHMMKRLLTVEIVMATTMAKQLRLCKLDCVVLLTFSVTFCENLSL